LSNLLLVGLRLNENLEATRIARVQDIIVFAARKSTGAHCRRTIGHQLFLSLDSQ